MFVNATGISINPVIRVSTIAGVLQGRRQAPLHTLIEALDHAVGLARVWFGITVVDAQLAAGRLEAVSREATAAISQHMGYLEGQGGDHYPPKAHGADLGLPVLDGEVSHCARRGRLRRRGSACAMWSRSGTASAGA